MITDGLMERMAWSVSRKRGFESRYVQILIGFLNKFFFFALESKQSAALSSATLHAMPPVDFGRMGGSGVS